MGKGANSEPLEGSSLGVDGAPSVVDDVGAVNETTDGDGDGDDDEGETGDTFSGYEALGVGDGDDDEGFAPLADDEDDEDAIVVEREGAASGGGGTTAAAAAAASDSEAKGKSLMLDHTGLADQMLSGIERDYQRTVSGQLSFSERALVGGAARDRPPRRRGRARPPPRPPRRPSSPCGRARASGRSQSAP